MKLTPVITFSVLLAAGAALNGCATLSEEQCLVGDWYGIGPARGMALVFSVTGVQGVAATLIAFQSRQYRQLSATYAGGSDEGAPPERFVEAAADIAGFNAADGGESTQTPPARGG